MTNAQMVKAFNEWMRRFIDDPEGFEREFQSVNKFLKSEKEGVEPTYGESCTAYMDKLAAEFPAE